MDDLLQSQIQDSCRLALPEGLKDLMSDISREVLRAQPANLLQFITDYLSALLVTRENLITGAGVCDDICDNVGAVGLEDELRDIGVSDEDIEIVKELVDKHLMKAGSGKPVKEGYLLSKIMRKTSIDTDKISDIIQAVRKAFVRHQAYNTTIYENTPDSSLDSISRAAHHTFDLYRKTKTTDEQLHKATVQIEAAYRAYGVRRQIATEKTKQDDWFYNPEIMERAELEEANAMDRAEPPELSKPQHISFNAEERYVPNEETESHFADTHSAVTNISEKTEDIYLQYQPAKEMATVSSYSLAGSYIILPNAKPYSVQEDTIKESENEKPSGERVIEENVEKQQEKHFNVDYTTEEEDTDDTAVITEHIKAKFDCESDDTVSDSSIEEDIDRRVVIASQVEILTDNENVMNENNQRDVDNDERKIVDSDYL